jgi:NADPH:quinone reductase-like Zn-dependent oxidoreductase
VLQEFLDAVSEGTAVVPVAKVYAFEEIVQAHADMEADRVAGKLVVAMRPETQTIVKMGV